MSGSKYITYKNRNCIFIVFRMILCLLVKNVFGASCAFAGFAGSDPGYKILIARAI